MKKKFLKLACAIVLLAVTKANASNIDSTLHIYPSYINFHVHLEPDLDYEKHFELSVFWKFTKHTDIGFKLCSSNFGLNNGRGFGITYKYNFFETRNTPYIELDTRMVSKITYFDLHTPEYFVRPITNYLNYEMDAYWVNRSMAFIGFTHRGNMKHFALDVKYGVGFEKHHQKEYSEDNSSFYEYYEKTVTKVFLFHYLSFGVSYYL